MGELLQFPDKSANSIAECDAVLEQMKGRLQNLVIVGECGCGKCGGSPIFITTVDPLKAIQMMSEGVCGASTFLQDMRQVALEMIAESEGEASISDIAARMQSDKPGDENPDGEAG